MDYDLDGDISDSDVSFASQSFIDLIGIGLTAKFSTLQQRVCTSVT